MARPILPPTYFLASLVLVGLAHAFAPLATVAPWPWRLAGLLPIALGAGLNLAADGAFKARATTVKPFERSSALVVDGVFRFTRNPMYLGMTLILAGVATLLGSLSPLLVSLAFAALMQARFIRVEETTLAETFGAEWEAYAKRTRRWI